MFRSIQHDTLPPDQLQQVLAGYLELNQWQTFRQSLLIRCSVTALLLISIALTTHLLSAAAWVIAIGVMLALPIGAWIAELKSQRRLDRLLTSVTFDDAPAPRTQKVAKSS